MIDTNIINKESILEKISPEQIYEYYLGNNFVVGKSIRCPWRKDDTPSLSLFYTDTGTLLFKDHSLNLSGNCFNFVMKLFNLNYFECLKKLYSDITQKRISGNKYQYFYKKVNKINKNSSLISYTKKEFSQKELNYWKEFGISFNGLSEYNVISCINILYNFNTWLISTNNNPIFVYEKNSEIKIYKPFSNKGNRWLGNMKSNTLLGIDLIPNNYNKLIILTKSYKDCISIWENSGIRCICKSGENCYWTKDDIDLINTKSKKYIYLGDFDRTGIHIAWRLKKDFGIKSIFMSTNRFKRRYDYSDYFKEFGKESTINKLNSLILNLHENIN